MCVRAREWISLAVIVRGANGVLTIAFRECAELGLFKGEGGRVSVGTEIRSRMRVVYARFIFISLGGSREWILVRERNWNVV